MSLRSSVRSLALAAALALAAPACDDAGTPSTTPDTAQGDGQGDDAKADDADQPDEGPADDTSEPDPDVTVDGGSDAAHDSATEDVAAELPPVDDCEIEATLSSLQTEYFNKSCAFGACHSASGAKKSGNLDLSPGKSWAALVDVPALKAPGKLRVVPGDPDASFLVHKLEAPAVGEGDLMPFGAPTPMDPDCRIKRVREWIAAGAKDD